MASAILDGDRAISFADLAERVEARRASFLQRGVTAGQRVALVCRPDVETLVDQQALLATGALVVPVGAGLTADERARITAACAISWVVEGERLVGARREGAPAAGLALGLLSSGSTGSPKLVLHGPVELAASLEIYRRGLELTAADRVLALAPLEHGFGWRLALAALSAGACMVLPPRPPHPRAVVELARAARVTLLPASPRFFDLLTSAEVDGPLPDLRAALAAGGLEQRTHEAFTRRFGAPLWQCYGATEAGTVCVNRDGTADGGRLALGVPLPGVEIQLTGAGGVPVSGEEIGELRVRSPAVGLGYEGEHDGASAIEGGVFVTGDLARWRNGALHFAGRRKLFIDTGDHKVDPLEVEAVLRRHPGVTDAAVVGESSGGRQTLRALLVAPRPIPLVELTDFCARHLSPHKIPRAVEYRAELPRGQLGKLRRDLL